MTPEVESNRKRALKESGIKGRIEEKDNSAGATESPRPDIGYFGKIRQNWVWWGRIGFGLRLNFTIRLRRKWHIEPRYPQQKFIPFRTYLERVESPVTSYLGSSREFGSNPRQRVISPAHPLFS